MAANLIASDAETKKFKTGTFLKLSDCPTDFQAHFKSARQAIESGDLNGLKKAVANMKGNGGVPSDQCLDVCEMVASESGDEYAISLLAFAGYHAQKDTLTFLQSEKADFDMGSMDTGSPLIQMMIYAYIKQTEEGLPSPEIDISIVKFFTDNGTVLSRVLMAPVYDKSTALELAISFQRFDIVQVLIEAGADPILCGDGVVSPLLVEYTIFGTFNFIRWLFNNHLNEAKIPAFIDRLLETGVLFRDDMKHLLMEVYGRNPAHAFLLCGHEQTIKYLIQKKPELLGECDPFGKTALHLAVEEGDLDSVRVLLNCNANVNAEDKSSTTPYMLAMVNGHTEVIELLKPYHIGTNNEMVWALRNGYPKFFEEMHETRESEEKLLEPLDGNENTIAHLAAEDGNTSVFKVIFPNEHSDYSEQIFRILTTLNIHQKTPLHIVVEKGNIEILDALHERRAERSKKASKDNIFQQQAERVEKIEWKRFWDGESEELLLYACRHGTVEMVDYFLRHSISPTTVIDSKTPLSCAAEEGKHDIVEYLLKRGVPPTGFAEGERYISGTFVASECKSYTTSIEVIPDEYHPLMLATKRGHTNCVTLLLKKEANSLILSTRNYNCLMEAVSAGHRDVAVALLNHDPKWEDAMHHTVHGEKGAIITPFTMLIKEMPGVAKVALNKCLRLGTNSVTYNFGFLEHRKNQSAGNRNPSSMPAGLGQRFSSLYHSTKKKRAELLNHPLSVMIKHKRLELLQHPLVSRYISFRWWRLFPFIFAYLLLYILFLVLLTVYAVVTPRPGPDNQYCPGNFSGNSTDGACLGLAKGDLRLFRALAVLIILLCVFFLLPQVIPVRIFLTRHTTSAIIALFIRFVTIVLSIIFVSGFGNKCWCTPSWQWQIGAMAVFLAYLLFILQLGGTPYFGVYIYMLVNIVLIFVKLVYLPFLLILSFAIPFYMLFVRESGAQIEPFTNPARAIFKVIFQTVGQLDVGSLLESGDLLYTPFIEILFLAFVILMPLLFITMLVGLAVGTTEKDIENAKFKGIDLQVEYILTAKIFEPLMKLWNLPKNLKVYVGSESPDSATHYTFLGLNKLRAVNCGELAQTMKEDDRTCKVVKENVTSVIGIEDSLLDYTDRGLQNIQSEIKGMRDTLEELQKRDKILSTLRSDIRTIKASNKSLLYLQSEVKSIREELQKSEKSLSAPSSDIGEQ